MTEVGEKKSKRQVCLESLRVLIDKCGKQRKNFRKKPCLTNFGSISMDLNGFKPLSKFIVLKIQVREKISKEGCNFRVYTLLGTKFIFELYFHAISVQNSCRNCNFFPQFLFPIH